jgi:hypothetical protein
VKLSWIVLTASHASLGFPLHAFSAASLAIVSCQLLFAVFFVLRMLALAERRLLTSCLYSTTIELFVEKATSRYVSRTLHVHGTYCR